MKYQVSAETAILVTKYALTPIQCWPPPIGASTWVILRRNLCLCVISVNLVITIMGSLCKIYEQRHDPIRIIKITSEMNAITSALVKIIICKIHAPRLQALIADLMTFLKDATREERELIQSYVDKCVFVHSVVFITVIIGPSAFILAPMLTSAPLPTDSVFPFSMEKRWVWLLLYIMESISVTEVACMVLVDVMFAILLWYAGARFQMLSTDFRKVTNADDVHRCVRKHQALIRYTDELKAVTRVMAVEVTVTAGVAIVAGGFILISHPSLYELTKYVFYEIGAMVELFLYSWPADNLIETSNHIADAVYDCDWVGKSPNMLKDLPIIVQRCRSPIIIHINGILPALSLECYGSTMTATFSYLTTLRAMTDD